MLEHPRPGVPQGRAPSGAGRRELARIVVLLLSLLALVATSSALNLVTEARAADEPPPPAPKRAVVVSGPVHGLTSEYRAYARAIADAAEAEGMEVKRLLYPSATPESVKRVASGADLFVYVGHGNGWPSPYPPFQEATKNGLGLSPNDPEQRTTSNVVYKGADWLRANIQLAPNAVVILSHLSYASGNASSGMALPTRDIAIQRADNFANGFLSIGARVVWALGWQPGADVVRALFREDATMDAVFRTRYRSGVNPLNGWIGWAPGTYESQRIPGAVVHIDPDPTHGYLRGLTGDLEFTTTEWRDPTALPPDTEPPVISDVSIDQPPATIATDEGSLPVFTPNGDGISDTVRISHVLSENAFLDLRITKDGTLVRQMSVWAMRGRGSTTWDGRRDNGGWVGEGVFRVEVTPTDRAGNVGEPGAARVLVLNSMKSPAVAPQLFYPVDGDDLADTATFSARLTRPATVSWLVKGADGTIVRRGLDGVSADAGAVRFAWDGTDDAGQPLPMGTYTGRIRVTRPAGSYGHDVRVRLMPFVLSPSAWKVTRGDEVKLYFTSAEPLKGRPVVTAKQPGLKTVELRVVKLGPTTFKAAYDTRRAGEPRLIVRVTATDSADGIQRQSWTLSLR
jgi:flagellar hook assembly protein FlgD